MSRDEQAMAMVRQHQLRVRWSHHKKQWVASMISHATNREINMAADDPAEAIRLVVQKGTGGAIDV